MAKTILLVDDSATARMFVQRCLEISKKFEGAMYLEAANGVEAMQVLLDKSVHVDIVFSDLNMPKMDGEMLVKRMKANPRLNDVPVVVISSAGNPAKERQLLDMAVRAVVKKPVSPAGLASVLSKLEKERNITDVG